MEFVAIIKTYADLAHHERPEAFPDFYPAECREFETKELAQAAYPNSHIMTIPEYHGYIKAMKHAHQHLKNVPAKKSWWRFW